MKTKEKNEPVIHVKHACGHTVTCPREWMPPGRQKEEEGRDCAACRHTRRIAAMDRNLDRGLPLLQATLSTTKPQVLLAEEIRDRWHAEEIKLDPFPDGDEEVDPLWWIASHGHKDQRDEAQSDPPEPGISRGMTPEEICAATGIPAHLLEERGQTGQAEGENVPTPAYPNPLFPPSCVPGAATRPRRAESVPDPALSTEVSPAQSTELRIEELPIAAIAPSPLNPRVDLGDLSELAASIREHGILQPLVVRHRGGMQEPISLLAGHRRLAAAKLAGLSTVPCIVRKAKDDAEALSVMLVENLQREDLDILEQAGALARLQELGHTQTAIAQQLGKSQPWVANAIRLTRLPERVQERIRKGELSPAHGRALLKWIEAPAVVEALAERAVENQWDTKSMERSELPAGYDLQQRGLVRQVNHETLFEWEGVCRSCPFGCFRAWGHSETGGWCLKPEHYDQLQKEEITRRNAAYLEQREQEHAEQGSKGAEVAMPGTMMEAYAKDDPLSTIQAAPEFSWSTMEQVSGEYSRSPTGCDSTCPCRGVAQKGGVLVDVCLDKKRRSMLEMMDTKRKNKAGRAKLARLKQRAEEWAQADRTEDDRLLGWIALHVMDQVRGSAWEDAANALGLKPPFSRLSADHRSACYDQAAELGAGNLIALMALALMEHEIGQQLGYQTWNAPATEWLLGKEGSE